MASQQERKKAQERRYLDWFLTFQGWAAEINPDHNESPDFILQLNDRRCGIEITHLMKEQSPEGSYTKRRESNRSRFVQRLAAFYYGDTTSLPLQVQVNISGKLSDDAIPKICELLRERRSALAVGERDRFLFGSLGQEATFYLKALPESRPGYRYWPVVNNSVGWVKTATPELLTDAIQEKAQKLSEYHQNVQDVMLLIVAERLDDSGKFDIPTDLPYLPNCGFSEVHLLIHPERVQRIA